MKYKTVIGLEVHVQLKTKTKMFCSCSTTFGSEPNSQTCPVCLGLPGSLPVLNEEALNLGIKAALALNCKINSKMRFDRKNYFYPDLPKDYQISQYGMPLATGGYLDIEIDGRIKRIRIRRLHLEEDAGKLIHIKEASLIDFNRCGLPLAEIVSEPELDSPDEAYNYLKKLKSILKSLNISDCNMQEGSLRCDANISVNRVESKELGTKTEIKNMNSFKAVRDALSYEIKRQIKLLEEKNSITQETRLWNEGKKMTFPMRSKEEAHDYRYFPEPDLPEFEIEAERLRRLKEDISRVELPDKKRDRFIRDYKLSAYEADLLTMDEAMAEFYERCIEIGAEMGLLAKWLIGPVTSELNKRAEDFFSLKLKPEDLVDMINRVNQGEISEIAAKEVVLPEIMGGEKSTAEVLKEKDITQISDSQQLNEIIERIIRENPKPIEDYKQGKKNALMFLIGQVMKETRGKANPKVVSELLTKKLEEDRSK